MFNSDKTHERFQERQVFITSPTGRSAARGSTGTASKPQAIAEERHQRERLRKSYSQVIDEESREQQRKTIQQAADEFLKDYRAKHRSATFASIPLGHVCTLLGGRLVVEITPKVVKRYQADRLKEKAGPEDRQR